MASEELAVLVHHSAQRPKCPECPWENDTVCQEHVFGENRHHTVKSWDGKPVRGLGDLPV